MIFFTADQHFGHENILDYTQRPFNRISQMNNAIIERYRKVVRPEDTCYFIGDLTIVGPQHRGYIENIMCQLPGQKILILGNHDKFDPFVYMELGFESVHTVLEVEGYILVHDPAYAIQRRLKPHLCGHVHTLFKKQGNCINVGVDQWGFFPVALHDIKRLLIGETDHGNYS